MKIQTKNKIFTTLVVFICSLVVLGFLVAITNYFSKRKTEPIQLANEIPIFEVERTGGNNTEKSLLPIPITNLNKNKYAHLITIDHKAIFNPNGIELGEPLYLKIATRYDTHNTFAKPEQFFNLSIKVAGVEYNDATRPKMTEKGETKETQRNIKISIEQRDLITNKNPKLDLIIDYELVDSKGNGFGGGSQTIENKTTQQTTPNTNDTTHTPLTHHTHGTSALNPLQKLSLENVTFAAFGNKELQKSPTQNQSLLDPYLTYPTHEGDIIREYRLFPNMVPTQKDHADRTNYFERQDFEDMMNKYDLKTFPTRWTNGRENLYNLEYENGKRKIKHEWSVSKANYSLIQTNQPNNSPEMMTQDIEGANGFWNKSDCFLNTIRNIDVFNILNGDIKNNTPYIRFVTKNLEVEFDWLTLIACEFQEFMSLTAAATYYTVMAQEHTALVQYCTAFAQRNTENAQYFPSRAQEHTAEAQQYTAWAQQDTVMAQEYTADAQQTIQQLQSNNQPKKITINLTEKTITDYSKPNSTKQVPYFELSYDLDELVNFINKLDLSNNPHLQKVRQFVNDFTGKGDKNKKNRPSNEGLFSYPNQTNDLM